MADEELAERCPSCGTQLIRTDAGDAVNTHGGDAVTCPSCLELIRVE